MDNNAESQSRIFFLKQKNNLTELHQGAWQLNRPVWLSRSGRLTHTQYTNCKQMPLVSQPQLSEEKVTTAQILASPPDRATAFSVTSIASLNHFLSV